MRAVVPTVAILHSDPTTMFGIRRRVMLFVMGEMPG